MKTKILEILRGYDGVVSGEKLSASLGVSRVSIWKHIHRLQELGYTITSSKNGYRLEGSFDFLFPWEFPERASRIHYFEETESTMDIARDIARKGCPDFTVVIAERQSSGRGRLKRKWVSADGGLYFTMVIRPDISPVLSFNINFLCSLVLAKTLRKMFGIEAAVKWPNDILVDGKKLSGMLSEMETEADMVSFINVGIGLNVNNDPTKDEPGACSLKGILGKPVPRKEILSIFLDQLESKVMEGGFENVVSEWKKYTITINRHVKIVTNKEVSEGFAVDVDDSGALILELPDGSLKKVIYGDCFHKE